MREVKHEAVDVTVGFNFSYFIFKERADLLTYFRRAHESLRPHGLFVVDLYGGADSQRTLTESRDHDAFDYVWDQDLFDPINNRAVNYIHFEFKDGSKLRKAFTYEWRLWTLPEITELLAEAGFSKSTVYWEGSDSKGEGTGVFRPRAHVGQEAAWVAYVIAEA